MKITKTEISERTFVPYKIEIVVESKEDHNRLKEDIKKMENEYNQWYRLSGKFNNVIFLLKAIKDHVY